MSRVEVEVKLHRKSNLGLDQLKCEQVLGPWLKKLEYVPNGVQIKVEEEELKDHVEYVMVCGDNISTHVPSVDIIYWSVTFFVIIIPGMGQDDGKFIFFLIFQISNVKLIFYPG